MRSKKGFQANRVLSYFKAEWVTLATVTVSGLIYNIGLLAAPWFEGRMAGRLVDILGGSGTFTSMLRLAVCYAAVTALVQGARYIKRFCVRRFANDVNRRMKRILYGSLIRKSRAGEHQSQHRQPHQNLFHVILLAPPRDSRHIIA